jgi:hypothetical protein
VKNLNLVRLPIPPLPHSNLRGHCFGCRDYGRGMRAHFLDRFFQVPEGKDERIWLFRPTNFCQLRLIIPATLNLKATACPKVCNAGQISTLTCVCKRRCDRTDSLPGFKSHPSTTLPEPILFRNAASLSVAEPSGSPGSGIVSRIFCLQRQSSRFAGPKIKRRCSNDTLVVCSSS